MAHKKQPPPSGEHDGGEIGGHDNQEPLPPKPLRSHRQVLARVPLGTDELVLSVDDRDRIDIRLWTATGGVRMASRHGLTLHLTDLPKLIGALALARGEADAHA